MASSEIWRGLPDLGNSPSAASSPKPRYFSNAKDHGIAIHLTGRSIRLIRHAIGRIQQNSRTHRPPLLLRPRSTDGFEADTILGRQYKRSTLPSNGHGALKHSRYNMSSYLENTDLEN